MMYGVPNMKTDKEQVVMQRIHIMEEEGIKFVCGEAGDIGKEGGPSPQDLLDSNDAVLLATGATLGRDMDKLPGRSLNGVHLAMEFLNSNTKTLLDNGAVNLDWRRAGSPPPIDVAGKHVVVIGGGDTGNDCIGTSVRHGATGIINLELLPKPPPTRAPGTPWPHWPTQYRVDYGHEEAARATNEGNDIRMFSVTTKEFVGDTNGNVRGVKIADVQWKHKDGRMHMSEVSGTERLVKADAVFLALGFLGPETPLAQKFGVQLTERGNYKADFGRQGVGYRTTNPKVFAAGDCRRGQSLVVWGIAEGREASKAIHKYIMGPAHFPSAGVSDGAMSAFL